MSASLAEDAEDIYTVVCDFGGAACAYADSDVGEVVDFIAEIGAKLPGVVGQSSRAYDKVKTKLEQVFLCSNGDSITCAASLIILKNSGTPRTCPSTATGVAFGAALAVSQCAL